MTLARRMWLASAALALLVGAAFTALILAVSAQREAADRETRSKDVTAASLQLERVVSDVESGFLSFAFDGSTNSLRAYRQASRQLNGEIEGLTTLVQDDPSQREGTGDRDADPGVRVRLTPADGPDRAGDAGSGQERPLLDRHRQVPDQRDPAALRELPARGEHARRSGGQRRGRAHGHRGARRRCRCRRLDGPDRALRDRARTLDRATGARGRQRRRPDRRRRTLAPTSRRRAPARSAS